MNIKQILLIFCIIILPLLTNAQNEDSIKQNGYEEWKSSQDEYVNFDIGKYYTPNIVRNQLPINFNLNSNYSHSNLDGSRLNFYGGTDNYSSILGSYNFTGNIVSNFSHYVNTRKKISNFGIGLSLNENYSFQKINQPLSDNDSVVSLNNLDESWSNKWYFSKLFYLNYNVYSGVFYGYRQNKIKNQLAESNQKQNEYGFYVSPRLGIGYGRIEDVEDARQAVYIANALTKKNVLTRNLSNEELFDLSQQISTVKNKRFLDSRLHLIDEISKVDSFFVERNLLNDTGAAYFTTLYDMWQYGALFPRKAGYEISFLIYPNYTYDYMKYTPVLEGVIYYPHKAYFETFLAFNYEKPFKLNWQHSVEVGSIANFQQGKSGETDFKSIFSTDYKTLSAWTRYSLGYYPNTRTNIQATAEQQIAREIYKIAINNNTTYIAGINVSINYYLSPYFCIVGSFNFNYNYFFTNNIFAEYYRGNNYYTAFNVQFVYSIF